jgi:3-dehydroquinate dehydratase-2
MDKILVLHGPNLNLLGSREPSIYGNNSLEWINQRLIEEGQYLDLIIETYQSNHEGDLIDRLHEAIESAAGVVINAGGYTSTSVSLRDAIAASSLPVVEVHLTNISARESFRHISLISPVCVGSISGFGWRSYLLGVQALAWILAEKR